MNCFRRWRQKSGESHIVPVSPFEPSEKERVIKLAERLKTHLPGGIKLEFWSLPILEALLDKVEKLEDLTKKS